MHSDWSNGPNSIESFPHYQGILDPNTEYTEQIWRTRANKTLWVRTLMNVSMKGELTKWVVSSLNCPGQQLASGLLNGATHDEDSRITQCNRMVNHLNDSVHPLLSLKGPTHAESRLFG